MCVLCCSYMETEMYEEAVRDYEKVYQTEKTKGENQTLTYSTFYILLILLHHTLPIFDLF